MNRVNEIILDFCDTEDTDSFSALQNKTHSELCDIITEMAKVIKDYDD